jgi:hypothetical protein
MSLIERDRIWVHPNQSRLGRHPGRAKRARVQAYVAAIHFLEAVRKIRGFWKMGGRDKPGHDEGDLVSFST